MVWNPDQQYFVEIQVQNQNQIRHEICDNSVLRESADYFKTYQHYALLLDLSEHERISQSRKIDSSFVFARGRGFRVKVLFA